MERGGKEPKERNILGKEKRGWVKRLEVTYAMLLWVISSDCMCGGEAMSESRGCLQRSFCTDSSMSTEASTRDGRIRTQDCTQQPGTGK